jgi:glycosyltransferase involved in cell wall biosynthesis
VDTAVPAVSVVVPSYNSARTIGACLESLLAQDTALAYEVIVVDSSDDGTPAVVAQYEPRVTLLRSGRRLPPGPARNLGIAHARAPVLAFTDADCVAAPDWLEALHAAHARHDAVGGRIDNGTPGRPFGTALWLAEFVEFAGGPERQVASMPSCNISYKKRLLEAVGPFPDVAWGEEYILNHRIAGGVRFVPGMGVRHVNRTGFAETVRHARTVGRGAALSRRATGEVQFLFRHRWLIPALWPWRLAKIAACAARAGQALPFLVALPVLAVDLAAWTLGFLEGTARPGAAARGRTEY